MRGNRLLSLSLAIASVGAAVGAFAQASFGLRNCTSQVTAPVFDWSGNLLSGADWRAELYGGATMDSLTPVVSYYGGARVAATFSSPGCFTSSDGFLSVMAVPPSGWAWLQVRAWDAGLGATYEEAVTRGLGGYGESAPFYARGGNPLDTSALPAPLIGLQSFSVLPVVPEPSVWALLAVGLGGLCWCVRRKRAFLRHPG